MHKLLTILFTALILTVPATALQAELFPLDRTTNEHKAGQYIVQVTNDGETSTSARVKTQSQCSDCFYVPDSYLQLQPGESKNATIILQGDQDIPSGRYRFTIFASEIGTSQNVRIDDYFKVERGYSLIFSSFNTDKESYRPGETAQVSVQVKNIGGRTIEDYRVNASFLNQTAEKQGLKIINNAERSYDFTFQVPGRMSPGTEIVDIEVYRQDQRDSTISRSITIASSENVEIDEEISNRLITSTTVLKINNTGNVNTTTEIKQSVPGYLAPVTTFNPRPDNITASESSQVFTWSIQTSPGQNVSVGYTIHYWIPLLLIAGLIAAIVLYKRLTAGIQFEKHVSKTEKGRITVNIEIENTSSSQMEGLSVVDFVPNIASVDRSFQFAKPSIRKKNDGTQLTWDLDTLEPGDQRVLEYTIQPHVEVEGKVTLPSAELKDEEDQVVQETSKLETDFQP